MESNHGVLTDLSKITPDTLATNPGFIVSLIYIALIIIFVPLCRKMDKLKSTKEKPK